MSDIVKMVPKGPNKTAIEYARSLLTRCESGEVIGVTAVEERPDCTYALNGSEVASRTQTAGMLLDAAIMRLNGGS